MFVDFLEKIQQNSKNWPRLSLTTCVIYVQISDNCHIQPGKRSFEHFDLGPLLTLMCEGEYAFKNVWDSYPQAEGYF